MLSPLLYWARNGLLACLSRAVRLRGARTPFVLPALLGFLPTLYRRRVAAVVNPTAIGSIAIGGGIAAHSQDHQSVSVTHARRHLKPDDL
jgi:hypothetical protein